MRRNFRELEQKMGKERVAASDARVRETPVHKGSGDIWADVGLRDSIVPMLDGVMSEAGIRLDKLLFALGLAESKGDAHRRIICGAVFVNAVRVRKILYKRKIPGGVLLVKLGSQTKLVSWP